MKLPGHEAAASSGRPNLAWVLVALALVFFILAIGIFILSSAKSDLSKGYLADISDLKVLSHSIPRYVLEAAQGNTSSFDALAQSRNNFEQTWKKIKLGERDQFLISTNYKKLAAQELSALESSWAGVRESVDLIATSKDSVLQLYLVSRELDRKVGLMQEKLEFVVKKLRSSNGSDNALFAAQQKLVLIGRLVRQLNDILEGKSNSPQAALNYARDVKTFTDLLASMQDGTLKASTNALQDADIQAALRDAKTAFSNIEKSVVLVERYYPSFVEVKKSQARVFSASPDLYTDVKTLSERLTEESVAGFSYLFLGAIATSIAVLSLFGVFFESVRQARARYENEERVRREEEQRNQKNQEAILRLLDELGDLADGDLTIQTTVTEDFTGAIADSINFTIDQLRSLVSTINETAVQVSSSAQETQTTAISLAEASEHQAQEIAGASTAINQMAASIDQVSANASESSGVAERSVTIANKGSEVVHDTIRGMDTIREQIQETAKRIKRLGESSQEIGDIVSLITDIADQTNILALNAAIQASMAGDAGRGFAVVADEVQRLAERASAATKQIEGLVKTIQTDTNEAVISMEHTTAEVVRGARLAQNAGVALEEIENVSRSLADLIQNISNAARQQAASAGHVSNTMNVIQEITSQTTSSTTATANSIGNLAELAVKMRNSVAGFKLPEQR